MKSSEVRDQLKREILDYFRGQGLSRESWVPALQVIKDASFAFEVVGGDWGRAYSAFLGAVNLGSDDSFYPKLADKFSPIHYSALSGFVKRYEQLVELKASEESQLEDLLEEERRAFFYDAYELGDAKGEVRFYSDRIEVESFEYQEGFTGLLPRGGSYQGKGSGLWIYPVSKRHHFDNGQGRFWHNFAVLYDAQNG